MKGGSGLPGEWEGLLAWIVRHKGKVFGTLLGLILGWLTIRYGILRAMLVTLFILAGLYVGARIDSGRLQSDLEQVLDRLFGRGGRR